MGGRESAVFGDIVSFSEERKYSEACHDNHGKEPRASKRHVCRNALFSNCSWVAHVGAMTGDLCQGRVGGVDGFVGAVLAREKIIVH